MHRALAIALLLLLSLSVAGTGAARAAIPSPDTFIENQAEVTYFNTALGITEVVHSNVTLVRVGEYPALLVERDQLRTLPPVTPDRFVFRVENIGNVDLNPSMQFNQLTSDDFNLTTVVLHHDRNGDGLPQSGERLNVVPAMTSEPMLLMPGQHVDIIVTFQTPADVTVGDLARSLFVASDAAHAVEGSSTSIVEIVTSGLMLDKRASKTVVKPGEEIGYTLRLRNNGMVDSPPISNFEGEALIVDGAPASGTLVRDEIPLHTSFVRIDDDVNFETLYHLYGNPEQTYVSLEPADLSQVDAVAFLHAGPYPAGHSTDLRFTVRVHANAAGVRIDNLAATWIPGASGGTRRIVSNTVSAVVPGYGGQLDFTDSSYTDDVSAIPGNSNTFIRLDAGVCNSTANVDQISVRLQSSPEGDIETVTATETGPNTGVFHVGAIAVQEQMPPVHENSVVSARWNTILTANAVCDGYPLSDTIVVNAGGFVFNSATNEGVAGATVLLYGEGNAAAPVATTSTRADGFFNFLDIAAGRYRIAVEPPPAMRFPSSMHSFPGFNRNTQPGASWGRPFDVPTDLVQWGIDVPIDPTGERALTLEKRSDKRTVRLGEVVPYELTIRNTGDLAVVNASVEDTLPPGLAYIRGSTRLDGVALADPAGAPGAVLTFDIGRVPANGTLELTYHVRVLATAGKGEKTNRAVASGRLAGGGAEVISNFGRWTVRIDERGGVFSDSGVVLGKVYLDCNLNGRQDGADEIGIPGVKIYTQNGRSVVTDHDGKYSLPGMLDVTHVLAVVSGTLPEKTKVLHTRTRDARDPRSRFVDLGKGELRHEDFPVGPCSEAIAEELKRRQVSYKPADGSQSYFKTDLPFRSVRRQPLSTDQQGEQTTTTQISRGGRGRKWAVVTRESDGPPIKDVAVNADLEKLIRGYSAGLGFADLSSGDRISRRTIAVRIKGPAEAVLELAVNGQAVPRRQLGQRAVFAGGGVQALEYVAVRLNPGENTLEAVLKDPFGNVRGRRSITILAPSKPSGIEIHAPDIAAADPSRPIPIVVRIVDQNGRTAQTPTEVTLVARAGHWDVEDIRDGEPGLQAYVDKGEAVFLYVPPRLAGSHEIVVRSTHGSARRSIKLTPDLGEEVVVGIVEGALRLDGRGSRLAGLMRTDQLTPFQRTTEGVRGALFLKGRIRGDALLTMRYQSDKDTEARLFRDVQPDEYYPVYGDASERGYEGQSTGQLFVKVEKGLSYILYGDIDISAKNEAIKLGVYSRKLTGVRAHGEWGDVVVDVFAGKVDTDRIVREIRGRGIAGPYDIDLEGFVENSETVEIITRDRDQPELVLETTRLTRFTDYTLDYFRGTILFDDPIDAFDENLNPRYIRITYDAAGDGTKYWIYGGEARYEIAKDAYVGYREVHVDADRSGDQRRIVRSAFASAELGAIGRAEVEVAQTQNHRGRSGWGAYATLKKRSDKTQIEFKAGRTDRNFDVPGAVVGRARDEVRGKVSHTVAKDVAVSADVLYSRDADPEAEGRRRYGAEGRVAWRISEELEAVAGLRHVVNESRIEARSNVTSAIVGMKYRPAWLTGAIASVEYEQDLLNSRYGRFLLANTYQYSPDLRFYVETEVANSRTGVFGLSETDTDRIIAKAGVEYQWYKGIKVFSDYRVSGQSVSGGGFDSGIDSGLLGSSLTSGALASGLRGDWELSKRSKVRGKLEFAEPVSGVSGEERTQAVAIGYTFEDEPTNLLFRSDLEWSHGRSRQGWYAATSFAKRDGRVSYLAQNRFAWDESRGEQRMRDRLRAGVAWRPVDQDTWSLLAWYGLEYDDRAGRDLTELTQSWAVGGEYRIFERTRLRARHAGRHYDATLDGISSDSLLLLATTGLEYELTKDINIAINATGFFDPWDGTHHLGIGGEIGYVVAENMMISLGYNFAELDEKNIRDIYDEGFFVRLKAKLGDDLWNTFRNQGQ